MRRGEGWMLLAGSGVLLVLAVGLLALVGTSLRAGSFDARSKGATEPSLLTAADDPFWFYGLQAMAALLGIFTLVLAVRMIRETAREVLPGAARRR